MLLQIGYVYVRIRRALASTLDLCNMQVAKTNSYRHGQLYEERVSRIDWPTAGESEVLIHPAKDVRQHDHRVCGDSGLPACGPR